MTGSKYPMRIPGFRTANTAQGAWEHDCTSGKHGQRIAGTGRGMLVAGV